MSNANALRAGSARFIRISLAAMFGSVVVAVTGCATASAPAPVTPPAVTSPPVPAPAPGREEFARLERESGVRLGVYAVDTGTGRDVGYRADERFAYASTYKALAAGAILQRTTLDGLNKRLTYRRADLVSHSPITDKHVDTGITLRETIDAAVRYSDNTAGNLLFRELGGPGGLAAALRGIGDTVTHADRIEPELNATTPGQIRDTSTPRALAGGLRAFAVGDVLPEDRRALLTEMLRTNVTGATLIRAGMAAGWPVGDKSGTADYATRNDIAVVWPPGRAPLVFAVLSDAPGKDARAEDALIARAASAVLGALDSR
jgi:beta-lactamase class A